MEFSEWVKLPDIERVFLAEIKVAKEIHSFAWTATGSGSYWCNFSYGEVVEVTEDGNAYTKVASVAECDSTASSFYYDFDNSKLYIHTSNGHSPSSIIDDEYEFYLLAFLWKCHTSSQFADTDDKIVYTPQDASHPVFYEPDFDVNSLGQIIQAVGDYYIGDIILHYGSISFLNDGDWYNELREYIWHNKLIELKIGVKGSAYNEFETIFYGQVRNPRISDERVTFDIQDNRVSRLKSIPTNKYWTSNYPNLDPAAEGHPIPIVFGQVEDITPTCIDTVNHIYKIADHELEAIVAVRKDKTTLVEGVDYTTDLANGQFTLASDPGDAEIRVDAKGVKCDKDTGAYSTNVADILYYVLVTLNDIDSSLIDAASFDDLKTARTQELGFCLDFEISTLEFIRLLQTTSVFQFIPLLSGKYAAIRYSPGAAADTPKFYTEDYDYVAREELTQGVYHRVVVKYAKNPSTGVWKTAESSDDKIRYRYDIKESLRLETLLRTYSEAKSLADFYLRLVKFAARRIEGRIPAQGLALKPSDKVIVSKRVVSSENQEISVLDEEIYRILELRKDLRSTRVEIVALEDIAASGEVHANVPHENTHSDTTHSNSPHSNVAHEDVAHEDTAHEDSGHGNSAHENVAHENVAHEDVAHEDVAHSNSTHADSPHLNIAHENTAHGNTAHENVAHDDIAHSDVIHDDVAHEDYSDHGDYHEDVAHQDTDHVDAHSDKAHSDSHSNSHTDVPHEDYSDHVDYYIDHMDDIEHADEVGNHDDFIIIPHENTHEDSHSNVAHGNNHSDRPHKDTAHEDSPHYDEIVHHNVAHEDIPHGNTAHENIAHENVAHSDVAHGNTAHSDETHEDAAHSNVAHENVAHENVAHENVAHSDVAHSDVAHGNSSHSNTAHENIAHENVAHGNTAHANIHNDIQHTNSVY